MAPANLLSYLPSLVDCITVESMNGNTNNVDALVVFAGRAKSLPLPGQSRPDDNETQYFETENTDLDNIYTADEIEDFVWIVAP